MTGDDGEALERAMELSGRVGRATAAFERALDADDKGAADSKLVVEVIRSDVPVPIAGAHSFDIRRRADRERLALLAKRLMSVVKSAALLYPDKGI